MHVHRVAVLLFSCVLSVLASETNSLRAWNDYRTIMWIGNSAYQRPDKLPLFFQRLREMGVNTAMVHGDGDLRPLLTNNFPYYVENMVTKGLCLKFSSKVMDWDKFVTSWVKNGRPEAAFVRDYSLDDPEWQSWARKTMQSLVRKNAEHTPLAYDIRDELSVTYSANPFDYDFSPVTLAKFREWLRTQYKDLNALNEEWQTVFNSWDAVKPFTTDEIKNRMESGDVLPRGKPDWQGLQRLKFDPAEARKRPTRWNFAPWCDFRTYMDLSLARTLGDLRNAAREIDPHTPVGIEGTQMPSAWGGYDLWRLSQAIDWIEPYDIGNAREILGSFMRGKPIVTTVFEKDTDRASRRLWHLLLEGDRGCIVWWSEDCIDWKSADYSLTPKAKALAPVLKEMTSPLAELYLRAERERDPIYLVYSQPSIQVNWLLESTRDGSTWLRRFSSFEAEHNRMAQKRNGWLKLLQDLGYSPQFMPADEITTNVPAAAFILSDTLALSAKCAAALDMVVNVHDRPVFTDGPVGLFDEHGRFHGGGLLEGFGKTNAISVSSLLHHPDGTYFNTLWKLGDMASIARSRLASTNMEWYDHIRRRLGLPRQVEVPPATHTRVHRFKLGDTRLLAFERNVDYHMSEDLKQAGGNEPLEKPVKLSAKFAQGGHVYELRTGTYLGRTDTLTFTLNPWKPSLFAITREKMDTTNVVAALLAR